MPDTKRRTLIFTLILAVITLIVGFWPKEETSHKPKEPTPVATPTTSPDISKELPVN